MSEFVITVGNDVTTENFLEAARAGRVKFHTVRSNGTTRRVQFYADGSKAREEAEWVSEQRAEGRTMREIAAELHLSVPSVRRILNALVLAETVEDYEPEDIEALLAEAAPADQEPANAEAAPEAAPAPEADSEPTVADEAAPASTDAQPVA